MNGNYPLGAYTSDAPWNEEEVDVTAYCIANVWYGLRKDVELECETKGVVSNYHVGYNVTDQEWEDIYDKTCMPPDTLIREMAYALECFANPTKENPTWEHVNKLLGEASGWECDNDGYSFDIESEFCDY